MNLLQSLCGTPKRAVWFLICLVCSLALMITIFCFSAQPAELSQNTSDGFFATVETFIAKLYGGEVPPTVDSLLLGFHAVLRKLAHAFVNCLLGASLCGVFCSLVRPPKWWAKGVLAAGVAVCYAISDECHQLFVPGRSGEMRDVLIDTAGIVIGVLLVLLLWRKQFLAQK